MYFFLVIQIGNLLYDLKCSWYVACYGSLSLLLQSDTTLSVFDMNTTGIPTFPPGKIKTVASNSSTMMV